MPWFIICISNTAWNPLKTLFIRNAINVLLLVSLKVSNLALLYNIKFIAVTVTRLQQHMRTHGKDETQCSHCHLGFYTKRDLQTHQRFSAHSNRKCMSCILFTVEKSWRVNLQPQFWSVPTARRNFKARWRCSLTSDRNTWKRRKETAWPVWTRFWTLKTKTTSLSLKSRKTRNQITLKWMLLLNNQKRRIRKAFTEM